MVTDFIIIQGIINEQDEGHLRVAFAYHIAHNQPDCIVTLIRRHVPATPSSDYDPSPVLGAVSASLHLATVSFTLFDWTFPSIAVFLTISRHLLKRLFSMSSPDMDCSLQKRERVYLYY